MQSKTSWFNKELMIQSFRNVGWIGIVYLVGLLFAVPLRVLMLWSDPNRHGIGYMNRFENVFSIMFPVQVVLMFAVPILLAIFLFRYLQAKSASDFMHSLPIKRTTLYNQFVGLGVLYLLVPILVNTLILVFMQISLGLDDFFTVESIMAWAGVTLVITLLVFLAGVFIGTITGISAVQGVLTFVLLLFPAGMMMLFMFNLDQFLFGFLPNYYFEYRIEKLSPISAVATFDISGGDGLGTLSIIEVIVYLAFAILFYGLGMWLYKIRNLETVLHTIVFRQMRPVFKYGVTFCVMLLGGLYFGEMQESTGWALFGYVVGSLIGYLIAEMLLQKTWRVFTRVKGYFIYALVIFVLGLAVHFDVMGYEGKVPELDEIERVYFADNSFGYLDDGDQQVSSVAYMVGKPVDQHKPYFDEPENIKAIQSLHEKIIANENIVKDPAEKLGRPSQSVFIAYELKNGDKIVRQYVLPMGGLFKKDLEKIYGSKEFKEAEYEVLHVNPSEVSQITVRPRGPVDKRAVIAEPKEIEAALKALKSDVMDKTYKPINHYEEAGSDITILLDGKGKHMGEIRMAFGSSFEAFENELEKLKKLKDARITADDISYAVIVKREEIGSRGELYKQPPMERMLEAEDALKVTSMDEIEECLQAATNYVPSSGYYIGFMYKDHNNVEISMLDPDKVPEFVKQHFE